MKQTFDEGLFTTAKIGFKVKNHKRVRSLRFKVVSSQPIVNS